MELKHSRKGIASFVIALVVWLLLVGPVLAFTTALTRRYDVLEASCLILCLLLNATGLGFGIVGLLERDRKHVFAVLGVTLSWLTVLVVMLLGFAVTYGW